MTFLKQTYLYFVCFVSGLAALVVSTRRGRLRLKSDARLRAKFQKKKSRALQAVLEGLSDFLKGKIRVRFVDLFLSDAYVRQSYLR